MCISRSGSAELTTILESSWLGFDFACMRVFPDLNLSFLKIQTLLDYHKTVEALSSHLQWMLLHLYFGDYVGFSRC